MPDVPGVPPAAELERLPHAELAALLAEAYQLIGRLQDRVEQLERAAGRDSSVSSRPPSPDSPFGKKPRDRSLRERGKRRPGATMNLAVGPDERLEFPPGGVPGLRRWAGRGAGAGPAPSSGH